MKPKILIVKYFDWALFALLGLALLYVLYISFLSTESEVTKLGEEIQRNESAVQAGMRSTYSPDFPSRNLISELKTRFEHMPVINPYQRNPFVGSAGTDHPLMQMMVDQEIVVRLTGARLLDVTDSSDIVTIALSYDPEANSSTVTFTGLKPGQDRVEIRDERDEIHSWALVVQTGMELLPPNPPYDVVTVSRPPQEIRRIADAPLEREAPMVLIHFQPNNPIVASSEVGFTTAARIFRKPADAPDIEYMQVHTDLLAPIQNQDRIEAIMRRFRIAVPVTEAAKPTIDPATGAIIPPEATDTTRSTVAETLVETPPAGSFIFLDETVDEGESYIYKIETLSTTEGAQPTATEQPYILPEPLEIPALVRFTVASVTASGARLVLSRQDPDTNQQITQEFRVMPGMFIGGTVEMERERGTEVDRRRSTQYKYVDFSTNCILVAVLPNYREQAYEIRYDRAGEMTYRLQRGTRVGQIIYLTPRGFLRMRGVGTEAEMLEQERRSTGGMRGGGLPGAMPGPSFAPGGGRPGGPSGGFRP